MPVFIRRSAPLEPQDRPSPADLAKLVKPWPDSTGVPADGGYLATAHWREILDAAITAGRDFAPWLRTHPVLAQREIAARQSPLNAYLSWHTPPKCATRRLVPNVIYRDGIESSARAAVGYYAGMAMAHWACCTLMGLTSTRHAEFGAPPGAEKAWSHGRSLPDLYGYDPDNALWLIEAKGSRLLQKPSRSNGVKQLHLDHLESVHHFKVLCGTSLETQVFMMIDVQEPPGPEPTQPTRPPMDDDALLALGLERLPVYLALKSLPRDALQIVPVGRPSDWRNGPGQLRMLEHDERTQEVRRWILPRGPEGMADPVLSESLLVGQIPGTGLKVGLSRRLFEVCRALDNSLPSVASTPTRANGEDEEFAPHPGYDHDRRTAASRTLYHRLRQNYDLRGTLRSKFEHFGTERPPWQEVWDIHVPMQPSPGDGALEAASADTYIAIDESCMPVVI